MNAPTEHHFSDGSSITVLENGSIVLHETQASKGQALQIAESAPISYNDPPPQPPAASNGASAAGEDELQSRK